MSQDTDKSGEESHGQVAGLPGFRLRTAREALGLSIAEVAAQLRLNERLITALEEDDYQHLPPAAFVAGYLRSYARLLGIPADAVIAGFEQHRSGLGEPPLVTQAATAPQVRASDPPVRLMTWLVVTGLIVLLGVWWATERQVDESVESLLDTAPVALEETAEHTEEIAAPLILPDPAEDAGTMPAAVSETVVPLVAATPAVAEATVAPLAPMAPRAEAELTLRYTADSWTEVTDASGERLAYELIAEGATLVLRGVAPFQVFLGYAPGVELRYRDQAFDHQRFIRGDIARFRVGAAADNRILE